MSNKVRSGVAGLPPTTRPVLVATPADAMRALEAARIARGLSINEVGEIAGYARGTYNHWLRGTRPTLSSLIDVAQALGWRVVLVPKRNDD